MNQTSRTDEPYEGEGLNQSPNAFSNDLVTNQDLNGMANARERRNRSSKSIDSSGQLIATEIASGDDEDIYDTGPRKGLADGDGQSPGKSGSTTQVNNTPAASALALLSKSGSAGEFPNHGGVGLATAAATAGGVDGDGGGRGRGGPAINFAYQLGHFVFTLGKFVGPGFLVAVAYIDPGNYSTGISAGASFRFRLLFITLLSNLFAILLQCLAAKLGTVTGLNLAEACRAFLPRWLNYFLYFLAEAAIIATDIAEVIGTAIALNLLIPALPLVAGCALSILDVFVILFFYRPKDSMKGLRLFEIFVMALVLTVVVCFAIQLSLIKDADPGEVFRGYLPSDVVTKSDALYQACGILGATVMPHSLYLGSGVVQSRLREYDTKRGLLPAGSPGYTTEDAKTGNKTYYVPSLAAINYSLKYTYTEVATTLVTFALFVNSAILIVAGASLYGNDQVQDADIFSIHDLLSASISPFAGVIFALALLFSGVSAGIVCTISGQMVCEGALRWRMRPWLRRLVTRSIAVTPAIIIAGATGRNLLNDALNGTQVVLSIVLPFVSAPLIWFTCFDKYMAVRPGGAGVRVEGSEGHDHEDGDNDNDNIDDDEGDNTNNNNNNSSNIGIGTRGSDDREIGPGVPDVVRMANPWYISVMAVAVWLIIVVLNVANLVLLGRG
ncbi:natural resistance-associated macrophage protein-domain-containing protein [Nemania sp. FL0916]|nr:natural resistance-associated macrophage protein-domain-containing protein [Nemania sp. FL0916]